MSKLVICEKPSVAKSIASALGVTSRADGYFEGGGWLISWCIGHLVGLADAAAYDDRYKKWRYSLVREDLFKSVRIGNAIRISKRSFDHWLESLDL